MPNKVCVYLNPDISTWYIFCIHHTYILICSFPSPHDKYTSLLLAQYFFKCGAIQILLCSHQYQVYACLHVPSFNKKYNIQYINYLISAKAHIPCICIAIANCIFAKDVSQFHRLQVPICSRIFHPHVSFCPLMHPKAYLLFLFIYFVTRLGDTKRMLDYHIFLCS